MRILSLTAACRLAERIVRQAGQPVPVEQLVSWLEGLEVDVDRAQASIRLAVTVGRLDAVTDDDGVACIRLPDDRDTGAVA
jgi:hypothetical protein